MNTNITLFLYTSKTIKCTDKQLVETVTNFFQNAVFFIYYLPTYVIYHRYLGNGFVCHIIILNIEQYN